MGRMPKVGVSEAQKANQWAKEVEVQVKVREEVGAGLGLGRALWPGQQRRAWSDEKVKELPLAVAKMADDDGEGWQQEEVRWRSLFLYSNENDSSSDYSLVWQRCLQHVGFNVCNASFDTCHEPTPGMSNLYHHLYQKPHHILLFVPLYACKHQSRVKTKQLFLDEFYTYTLRSSAFYFNRTLDVRRCQICIF